MKPTEGIAVDCGCLGNPGKAEYRGIDLSSGKEIFEFKIPGLCTNNIAEFAALVYGVKWKILNNINGKVWSDSLCAIAWYKKAKPKCKLVHSAETIAAWELLHKSLGLLNSFGFQRMGHIQFWDSSIWGEIPADYGRK